MCAVQIVLNVGVTELVPNRAGCYGQKIKCSFFFKLFMILIKIFVV